MLNVGAHGSPLQNLDRWATGLVLASWLLSGLLPIFIGVAILFIFIFIFNKAIVAAAVPEAELLLFRSRISSVCNQKDFLIEPNV